MRLISQKNLLSAIEPYADAQSAIESWCKLIKENDWESLEEVRNGYSKSVDQVCGYSIFNIKGNQYRLIVQVKYKSKIIYFKQFLTRAESSKINWDNEDEVKMKIS